MTSPFAGDAATVGDTARVGAMCALLARGFLRVRQNALALSTENEPCCRPPGAGEDTRAKPVDRQRARS